jgi:site-specific DNA-methyltransferase (adenine-specific)/adenine-specific DNA-methyltransferase
MVFRGRDSDPAAALSGSQSKAPGFAGGYLHWIGKKAVLNHHREVPYRLLRCDDELSTGDPDSGNLLVQGDKLLALKALFPYYAGKVQCIYIDPPYNTGNEKWVYNDAVNSPEMRDWLGKVVEAEDLSRHDKWLCMMYTRLSLLKDFQTEERAIFVSIEDNEVQKLRALMDEVLGSRNFIAIVIWQKMDSPKNTAIHLSEDNDYIVVYAKSANLWGPNKLARTDAMVARYKSSTMTHAAHGCSVTLPPATSTVRASIQSPREKVVS